MAHNQLLGAYGESRAARWYEAHGYEVLERNWRCAQGEVDLVVRRAGVVVFSEVKTRRSAAFGYPEEAVGHAKQARIRRLAARYLEDSGLRAAEVRFDVVAITGNQLEVFEGAF